MSAMTAISEDQNLGIAATSSSDVSERLAKFDWEHVSGELDMRGNATLEGLLTAGECRALAELYSDDAVFRSRVVMGRHGFGRGEYKYFRYPLPGLIGELRAALIRSWRPLQIAGMNP